jgi:hypothetical protein
MAVVKAAARVACVAAHQLGLVTHASLVSSTHYGI